MGREIEGAATSQVLVGIQEPAAIDGQLRTLDDIIQLLSTPAASLAAAVAQLDTATLLQMQRDLHRRDYSGHPSLDSDAQQQIHAIGLELLRRDLQSIDCGRPYLPGSRPEYTRDAAFAAICRGAR